MHALVSGTCISGLFDDSEEKVHKYKIIAEQTEKEHKYKLYLTQDQCKCEAVQCKLDSEMPSERNSTKQLWRIPRKQARPVAEKDRRRRPSRSSPQRPSRPSPPPSRKLLNAVRPKNRPNLKQRRRAAAETTRHREGGAKKGRLGDKDRREQRAESPERTVKSTVRVVTNSTVSSEETTTEDSMVSSEGTITEDTTDTADSSSSTTSESTTSEVSIDYSGVDSSVTTDMGEEELPAAQHEHEESKELTRAMSPTELWEVDSQELTDYDVGTLLVTMQGLVKQQEANVMEAGRIFRDMKVATLEIEKWRNAVRERRLEHMLL
jgi:hypothetical protein